MELVESLLAGEIVIPSIQRGYVWKPSQIPDFLDSIYKDYPIGSALMWQTQSEPPLKMESVMIQGTSSSKPLVLLDGQQRITSLAWATNPHLRKDGKSLDIRFDLETRKFLIASKKDNKNQNLIRFMHIVKKDSNPTELLNEAGFPSTHPFYAMYLQVLTQMHAKFHNYSIPVMTFNTDDYEIVADVFTRVNQGGVSLTKGDLINSVIAARWGTGLLQIDKCRKALQAANFDLGSETPFRLMSLIAGKGGKYIKLIDKDMNQDALKLAWEKTEVLLNKSIDFLRGECRIPNAQMLKSINVVIVPAYFYFKMQKDGLNFNDAQVLALKKWVYTAIAFGYYSSSIDGKLEADIKTINENEIDAALESLRRRALGNFQLDGRISVASVLEKKSSSGLFNLLYFDAISRGAKDWKHAVAIDKNALAPEFKVEHHHVFPKAAMKKIGVPSSKWDSIANLAFISAEVNKEISDTLPIEYVPKIGIAKSRFEEQLIPLDEKFWAAERFDEFLRLRAEMQATAVNSILGLEGNKLMDLEETSEEDNIDFSS
jgi:hypothetical protein